VVITGFQDLPPGSWWAGMLGKGDAFQALAEFDEQASAGWHILEIKVLLMYIDYTG
jgi:shikimate kinase